MNYGFKPYPLLQCDAYKTYQNFDKNVNRKDY